MSQDNRNFERIEKLFIVNIKPSGFTSNYYLGLTKNISMDGFSFESQNYDLKAGDRLGFELKDPEGGLNVSAAGKIIWKKATDFECLAGVQFLMLDDYARRNIVENVTENQQVNDGPRVQEEGPPGAINIKEEKPAGEAEGIISQAFSRISDSPGPDEYDRDEMAATCSMDPGMSSAADPHLEKEAVAFHRSVAGRGPEPVSDAQLYRSHQKIIADNSEKEKSALQKGEWEKTNRTHLYFAAMALVALIAAVIFFISDTGEQEVKTPVHLAVQEEILPDQEPQIISPVLQEISELEESGSAFLLTPDTELPVSDKVQEKLIVIEEQPPESTTVKTTEKVSGTDSAQRELVERPEPVREVTAVTEAPVYELPKKESDINREHEKHEMSAESVKTSDQKQGDRDERIESEQNSALIAKDGVEGGAVSGPEGELADIPGVAVKSPEAEVSVESMQTTGPGMVSEEQIHSEPEKISDKELLPSAGKMEKESAADLFVLSSQKGYITYLDNFDDNTNNWEQFNTNAASAQIKEGEYYLENKRGSGPHLVFYHGDFSFDSDFLIEVSIRPVKSSESYAYGLVFGALNAFDNYTFHVINNVGFSIRKYQKGVVSELASGTANNIYSNMHNTLRVVRQGNKIRFFINGKYLAVIPDLTLFGNRLGFIIEGQSEVSIDRTYTRIKGAP